MGMTVDTKTLKQVVLDRSTNPVIREILETLLQYLTEVLPNRGSGSQSRSAKKEGPCRTSMRTAAGNVIRRPTTFQLLQSKFLLVTPKRVVSHRRDVGSLNLKGIQGAKEVDKPSSEVGRGSGKGGRSRVHDMIGKFAAVEQKERELESRKRVQKLVQQNSKGPILSGIMKKFEALATVQSISELMDSKRPNSTEGFGAKGKREVIMAKNDQMVQKVVKESKPDSKGYSGHVDGHQSAQPEVKITQQDSVEKEKVNCEVDISDRLLQQQKKVRYEKEEKILFNCAVEIYQRECLCGLLEIEIPHRWYLATIFPFPEVRTLNSSTKPLVKTLGHCENTVISSNMCSEQIHKTKSTSQSMSSKNSGKLQGNTQENALSCALLHRKATETLHPEHQFLHTLNPLSPEISKEKLLVHTSEVLLAPYNDQESRFEPQEDIKLNCLEQFLLPCQYKNVTNVALQKVTSPGCLSEDIVNKRDTSVKPEQDVQVNCPILQREVNTSVEHQIVSYTSPVHQASNTIQISVELSLEEGQNMTATPHAVPPVPVIPQKEKSKYLIPRGRGSHLMEQSTVSRNCLSSETIKPMSTDRENPAPPAEFMTSSTSSIPVSEQSHSRSECCDSRTPQHGSERKTPWGANLCLNSVNQDSSGNENDILHVNSEDSETDNNTVKERILESNSLIRYTMNTQFPQMKEEEKSQMSTREQPKYMTINYSDASAKRTYVPKTIRFADTFNF